MACKVNIPNIQTSALLTAAKTGKATLPDTFSAHNTAFESMHRGHRHAPPNDHRSLANNSSPGIGCHCLSRCSARGEKSQTQIGRNKTRTLPCTCPFSQTRVILPPHLLPLSSHASPPTYGLLMKRSGPNTPRSLSFRFLLLVLSSVTPPPHCLWGGLSVISPRKGNKSH